MSAQSWVSYGSLFVALVALVLTLRRDFFLRPALDYSLERLITYPGSDEGFSLEVKRAQVPGSVLLKYGVKVNIRSTGRQAASNVQARVTAIGGAFIVNIHVDESRLVERLPDLGLQGRQEVFVNIPLMVSGERVSLTFWYGIPGQKELDPGLPTILVRDSEGLARQRR